MSAFYDYPVEFQKYIMIVLLLEVGLTGWKHRLKLIEGRLIPTSRALRRNMKVRIRIRVIRLPKELRNS
jgi:hypothetical protein